ncbi:MAG: AAA family ATPase [Gammaproteobacteria bacterium]|nr:MAG: AAA family ATPase [Gammaproteobacteria bacterium]RTZ67171.1 MAG: AAA family ATPase [Aquificaceae bacterium]
MLYLSLLDEVEKVVKGKREVAEYLIATLLAQGHALIEDLPGVGKTLLALALAKVTGLGFKRFQFTSDTLPADILGTFVFDAKNGEFIFKAGPIFTNVFLADEINRASPKTQSALLEAMAEKQVTVEGQTFKLPRPFFVIATQNPIEEWGTFPLPQSELDRFMIKTSVGYPPPNIEKEILLGENPMELIKELRPVVGREKISEEQKLVQKVTLLRESLDFAYKVVSETRKHPDVLVGISTRGAIHWVAFAKALSHIRGLDFVPKEILRECAVKVLAHRLVLKDGSSKTQEEVIEEILESVD